MLDLGSAAAEVKRVAGGVSDDQLSFSTPCPDYDLQTLLAHIVGLGRSFREAARKDLDGAVNVDPSATRPDLPDDWREQLAENVDEMAEAWRDPAAWEGMTRAGGLDLPAAVTGVVALNELVVHGWDVARASGQSYQVDDGSAQACIGFLASVTEPPARGRTFGPIVDVGDDAPLIDKVIALSGRDPSWRSSR
jgi:uncharacterized protein (TIGR03086 family)